jgi:hypothetical protein
MKWMPTGPAAVRAPQAWIPGRNHQTIHGILVGPLVGASRYFISHQLPHERHAPGYGTDRHAGNFTPTASRCAIR